MSLLLLVVAGCRPAGPRALRTGARLLGEGHPREAIGPLRQAVVLLATNAPACAQAWNHLALAYHYSGQLASADQAYQSALAKDFNLFVARYNRGCLLLEMNNPAGAINELTTYTQHCPQATNGWLRLGSAYLRAKQFDTADRCFQRALNLSPGLPEALNGLAVGQALRHRPHEAFGFLHAALKREANYAPAMLNEAIIAQQHLNDRSLALLKYKACLQLPSNAPYQPVVRAWVGRLEAELHPPAPPPPTNPPPPAVVTPSPAPKPTNLLAAAAQPRTPTPPIAPTPARTNPPPSQGAPKPVPRTGPVAQAPAPAPPAASPAVALATPRTNPPLVALAPPVTRNETPAAPQPSPTEAEKPKPAEPAAPPLEVVRVPAEPDVKAAQELASAPSTTTVLPPAGTAPTPPPAAKEGDVEPTEPSAAAAKPGYPPLRSLPKPKPPKKSLVEKINPLNWVGLGKKKAPDNPPAAEAAKPAPPAPQPRAPAVTNRVVSETPVVRVVKPAPVFARYQYRAPGKPAAGNRAEALRYLTAGLNAQTAGALPQAIASYRRSAESDPALFEAHYNLGAASYETGELAGGLAAYEQALAVKPADLNARFNFALTLQRANYPVDAASELDTILKLQPGYVPAHFALGSLCAQTLEQPAKARDHYRKVLELEPRHPQADAIRSWLRMHP